MRNSCSYPARNPKAWPALDRLMCVTAREPGQQRPFAEVPRLRLLLTGFNPGGSRQVAHPESHSIERSEAKSDGSWWHTGFPNWTTL